MPLHLHLDFETFSEVDLTEVGAYRYAQDATTEILCVAMAFGDEPPVIWHPGMTDAELAPLEPYFDALENPDVLVYAFNAQFEMAICAALLLKTWGIDPPAIERFRCVMSIARRAALPSSLDKLGEALNLATLKDKEGKALIKKFCGLQSAKKPTKKHPEGLPPRRIYPQDEPEAFAAFLRYCAQDVVVERNAHKKLAYFDDALNNSNYTLHEKINARGVPVNLVALRNAQALIEEETALVGDRFRALVGFNYTQNKELLKWVNASGYDFPNLQAETLDTFLDKYEDTPDADVDIVVVALRMKQSVAFVSIKKVVTMLICAGPHDNRIRGMLNHHGATTGRSTNYIVQFQNMKRPADHMAAETFKGSKLTWSEVAYKAICEGMGREMFEICFGPVLEVISSCIRHFVHDVELSK